MEQLNNGLISKLNEHKIILDTGCWKINLIVKYKYYLQKKL